MASKWEITITQVSSDNLADGGFGRDQLRQRHLAEPERQLTRKDNVIFWEISIEDPKVFTRPWQFSRHLIHGLEGCHALEEAPCVEHDGSHLVNNDRNQRSIS